MPGFHWGTRLVTPLSPFSLPTSLSPSLTHCGSLSTFPTHSALVCGEGAFDIHNLVQRRSRSPESLYGFHGNRLVQRTWCSDGGERETYSKNRAPQVWQELDQLPSRGAGRGWARLWGALWEELPFPHPLGSPIRSCSAISVALSRLLLLPWAFWLGTKAPECYYMPQFPPCEMGRRAPTSQGCCEGQMH